MTNLPILFLTLLNSSIIFNSSVSLIVFPGKASNFPSLYCTINSSILTIPSSIKTLISFLIPSLKSVSEMPVVKPLLSIIFIPNWDIFHIISNVCSAPYCAYKLLITAPPPSPIIVWSITPETKFPFSIKTSSPSFFDWPMKSKSSGSKQLNICLPSTFFPFNFLKSSQPTLDNNSIAFSLFIFINFVRR